MHDSISRLWLAVSAALVVWLVAFTAAANPAPAVHAGRIVLTAAAGGHGPVVLAPTQGVWSGEFTVSNVGVEPLTVSRLAIRGDEDDVRSPAHLSARFIEGPSTSATIAPGASKTVAVAWIP